MYRLINFLVGTLIVTGLLLLIRWVCYGNNGWAKWCAYQEVPFLAREIMFIVLFGALAIGGGFLIFALHRLGDRVLTIIIEKVHNKYPRV